MTPRSWRPFVTLESATVLGGTANGITMVAFPWLVLETTGDASAAAAVAAAAALPLLASMLFSGTIVDMLGRRATSVGSDLLSMVSVMLVPILAVTTGLSFASLMALAALGAVFDPAGMTARETMLPEAARRAGLSLERANGVHESAYGLAFLLGPGIGGLLIALVGATATFWATAVAFALSALLVATLRLPGAGRAPRSQRPTGLWSSTREGVVFLWRDTVLRSVAILTALLIGVWLPIEGVVLPYLYRELDSPGRLGLLVTAMSAGGVAGALLYTAFAGRFRRRTVYVVSAIGTAVPIVGMALLPPYPVMLALGVVTGLFYGPINPIVNLAIQHRTPERLRGRVIGLVSASAYAAGPAGYLLAGPLVDTFGVRTTFLAMAVGLVVVTTASLAVRPLRRLDDPPLPGSVGAPTARDRAVVLGEAMDAAVVGHDGAGSALVAEPAAAAAAAGVTPAGAAPRG